MARRFRRTRSAHAIAELNVTNLIDVAFTLLIIFMIATPLIQLEQTIPVNLPTVSKMPMPKPDKEDRHVALSVDASGRYYMDTNTVPVTLVELRSRLRAYAAEARPPVIRIRGDARATYQMVAQLFSEVEKAGLTRFTIDSQTDG